MRLSYKMVSSRPTNMNFAKLEEWRKLIITKLLKLMNPQSTIVNIDESTFGRDLGQNYTWSMKWKSAECQNRPFTGCIKLIWGISSKGDYFWHLSKRNTNSSYFSEFLTDFQKAVRNKEEYQRKHLIWLLYNAKYHKTSEVPEKLENIFGRLYFFHSRPQFASVELFFAVCKSKVRILKFKKTVNWLSREGQDIVNYIIKSVQKDTIILWFGKCYRQMKDAITL